MSSVENHNLELTISKEVLRIISEPPVNLQCLVACKLPLGQSVLNPSGHTATLKCLKARLSQDEIDRSRILLESN